jgi:hypothetical protein
MNLTELKAAAETAKTSPAELELWQMEISPDDVLRLVEVARAARAVIETTSWADFPALLAALQESTKGIEP